MTSNESSKVSRKNKKAHQQNDESEVPELTKEEATIARFLRLNCPNKQGNLVGMKVDFFIANKLVDCLMESKWGPGTLNPQTSKKSETQPLLASRQACIAFMQRLMNKQLFYHAMKIYKEQQVEPKSSKDSNTETTPNVRKRNKEKKENQQSQSTSTPQPSTSLTEQQQQKKKFKLQMHDEQKFFDANEPYVWVYDPTSTKTYIIGSLLILGAIGICLFPLWPSQVREGVYYLSLAGASFLGAILGLAAFKYVLFAAIYIVTMGKIQFWLFPNLTEDVGFFESFVPVYTCKCGTDTQPKLEDSKKVDTDDVKEDTPEPNSNDSTKETIETTTTLNPMTRDISKSTIEICKTTETPKGSPCVSLTKMKKKDSIVNDEDGFELLDDDDLIKEEKE